jgi:hypothetical protein
MAHERTAVPILPTRAKEEVMTNEDRQLAESMAAASKVTNAAAPSVGCFSITYKAGDVETTFSAPSQFELLNLIDAHKARQQGVYK